MLVVDDRSNPLVGTPSLGSAPTALLEGFAELGPKEIEVHVVSCLKQLAIPPSQLAANIWYHPLFVPPWAFLRTLHLGPSLAVRRFLRKMIQPDIVHSHGIEWWCGVAGAMSGYPSVLTIHGNIRAILRNSTLRPLPFWKLQALLGDFAMRRHTGVICISEHVRKSVALNSRKTWLIPNALRKDFLQQRRIAVERHKRPSLLVVGTITENKRPLEILEVLFALHAEGVKFNATFVGRLGASGRYEAQFAVRLLEASRLGFAYHKEHLSAGALAEAMAEAHALIHFPREEAFGLVVAEAMSQGMTIFASRVGELAELCRDYPECYLIDEEISLGTTIKQWVHTSPLRLHRDAPSWRMQSYLPKQNARLTLNAYRDATASLL